MPSNCEPKLSPSSPPLFLCYTFGGSDGKKVANAVLIFTTHFEMRQERGRITDKG